MSKMLNIVDGNAIANAMHNGTVLTTGPFQTQAIFGMARKMREIKCADDASVVVLWDGKPKERFEAFPEYKANREEKERTDPEHAASRAAYRAQVPIIRKMIELMGIVQMVHPHKEADDLAGYLVHRMPGRRIRLYTGDTDWLQLVRSKDIDWYDNRYDGKLITFDTFHQATGFANADEYLEGKVLQGDSTDNIPGVPDMGPKNAAAFIAEHRSLQAFWSKVDDGSYTPKTRKSKTAKTPHPEQVVASPEGRQQLLLNMQLMDLRNPVFDASEVITTRGRFDAENLRLLFARLGFASITRNFAEWSAPFEEPKSLPLAA
jgi:DNA polymerase I